MPGAKYHQVYPVTLQFAIRLCRIFIMGKLFSTSAFGRLYKYIAIFYKCSPLLIGRKAVGRWLPLNVI